MKDTNNFLKKLAKAAMIFASSAMLFLSAGCSSLANPLPKENYQLQKNEKGQKILNVFYDGNEKEKITFVSEKGVIKEIDVFWINEWSTTVNVGNVPITTYYSDDYSDVINTNIQVSDFINVLKKYENIDKKDSCTAEAVSNDNTTLIFQNNVEKVDENEYKMDDIIDYMGIQNPNNSQTVILGMDLKELRVLED